MHIEQIEEMVKTMDANDGRGIRKMSRKLLRNTLTALSSVYPLESRPFPASVLDNDEFEHWNVISFNSKLTFKELVQL